MEIPQTRIAFVGLGANIGDAPATLKRAVADLAAVGEVTAASRVYRSAPVGLVDQPHFTNAVVSLDTPLPPLTQLDALHDIERRHGRVRGRRFGPRTLDLDLIWVEGIECASDRLTLPHPRAHEREFVLRPLCDLDPDVRLRGRPAREWLAALEPQGVEVTGEALM